MNQALDLQVSSIRKPELVSTTAVPHGALSWAQVYQYNATDTGQIKSACTHEHLLYTSSRKGLWVFDSTTGRCGIRHGIHDGMPQPPFQVSGLANYL